MTVGGGVGGWRVFEHVQQHCCLVQLRTEGGFKKCLLFILFSVHKHLVTKVCLQLEGVLFCFFLYIFCQWFSGCVLLFFFHPLHPEEIYGFIFVIKRWFQHNLEGYVSILHIAALVAPTLYLFLQVWTWAFVCITHFILFFLTYENKTFANVFGRWKEHSIRCCRFQFEQIKISQLMSVFVCLWF